MDKTVTLSKKAKTLLDGLVGSPVPRTKTHAYKALATYIAFLEAKIKKGKE